MQTALVLELRVEFGKALRYSTKEFVGHSYNYVLVIGQVCVVKMAAYWPSSFVACLGTDKRGP